MKISILATAVLFSSLAAPIVSAQEDPMPTNPTMTKPMDMDRQMPQFQENIKKMQLQMEKIHATTDQKERQTLMQEHMSSMQENMKMMRGMGGPMMGSSMMDGGKHHGMAMGNNNSAMTKADIMQRHEMMVSRMDVMQMMMEQMMQHEYGMSLMSER
jgi:hypothetical protein